MSIPLAAIKAVLIICDVCRFSFNDLPGSQHLFSSGFGVAFLPFSDGMEAFVATGADHSLCLGETLRRMDCSVTCFAGLGVSTDAAVAALVDGCFEAIKLQI